MRNFASFAILALFASPLACAASADGTTSSSEAVTQADTTTAGAACTTNADCGTTEYCAVPEGQCGGAGTCSPRGIAVMCVSTVAPVCGCDQNTYRNGCEAKKAGTSLASEGPCYLPPSSFTMQYADTYDVAQPAATNLVTLALDPRGNYTATFGDGTVENGAWTSRNETTTPATVFLTNGSNWWSATITDTAGDLTIRRDGASDGATPEDTVGPNENLCDSSGGAWSDDDADPKTGLFCTCPAGTGQVYVPSQGGCVSID